MNSITHFKGKTEEISASLSNAKGLEDILLPKSASMYHFLKTTCLMFVFMFSIASLSAQSCPTNVMVSGLSGCYANGTYTPNGIYNGTQRWTSGNNNIRWNGTTWEIVYVSQSNTVYVATAVGTTTSLPGTGWVGNGSCNYPNIALVGGVGTFTIPVTPLVVVTANPGNSISTGTSVTFTATPTNGGSTPVYQWKKNNVNVGTNSDTYIDAGLVDGDSVNCVMTSNETCASPTTVTSAAVTMSVITSISPIRYVKETASGTGNGSSWANASSDLQAMIDATGTEQVWVAAGTYKPLAYPTGCTTCSGSRDKAFLLKNGVKIYGGFAGTEATIEDRTAGNETILSGDIDGDNTLENGNAYHVVISLNNDTTVVLDGLTIRDGNADATNYSSAIAVAGGYAYRAYGGGIYMEVSGLRCNNVTISNNASYDNGGGIYYYGYEDAPYFSNTTFTQNYGGYYGGGIYVYAGEGIVFDNVTFIDNEAYDSGAGLYLEYGTKATIKNCLFDNNVANNGYGLSVYDYDSLLIENTVFQNNQVTGYTYGGAIYASTIYLAIKGSTFDNNNATYGGAIYSDYCEEIVIEDCIFSNNTSDDQGGAIYSNYNTLTTINRCTFEGNEAIYAGGIYAADNEINISNSLFANNIATGNDLTYGVGPAIYNETNNTNLINCTIANNAAPNSNGGGITNNGLLHLANCILWGNTDGGTVTQQKQIYNNNGTFDIAYSLIQGGIPTGATNGGMNIYESPIFMGMNDYQLNPCSPAVNNGDNTAVNDTTDLAGNTRIYGGTVDMGAYELQSTPPTPPANAIPSITASNINPCGGTQVTLTATAPSGYTALEYLWYKNGATANYQNGGNGQYVINAGNTAGINDYSVKIVYASFACPSENGNSVSVNTRVPIATITPVGPTSFCAGTPTILNANTGMNGYTWKRGTTIVQAGGTYYTPSVSGNHTVTVTDGYGCTKTSAATNITVKALPIANAGADKNVCLGDAVQIGVASVSGNTYTWSPATALSNANISNPLASPTNNMTYTLTVNNTTTGCSKTDAVILTRLLAPVTPSVSATTSPVCEGTNITISPTSSGAASINWYKNGTLLYNKPTTYAEVVSTASAAANNYTIKSVSTNGCLSNFSNNAAAWVKAAAIPTITSTPAASGATINVCVPGGTSGNATLTASSTTASPNYQWLLAGSNITGATNANYTANVTTTANNKVISVKATYPNGCNRTSATRTVKLLTTGCTPKLGSDKGEADDVINSELSLVAYPNPTSGMLNVDITNSEVSEGKIMLYNALGQIVLEETINLIAGQGNIELNMNHLAAGVYSLSFITRKR